MAGPRALLTRGAAGQLGHDVEMTEVAGVLLDQVQQHAAQRRRLGVAPPGPGAGASVYCWPPVDHADPSQPIAARAASGRGQPAAASPTRLARAQRFLLAVGTPAFADAVGELSPDVTCRVLGSNAFSGTYTGREAVAAHLDRIVRFTRGTLDPVKWLDWLVGVDHVAALVEVHAQGQGARFHGRHLLLVRFDQLDRVDEVTVFFENLAAAERFFGRR